MMFSSLIISVAFLPLFTMTGVSGVIFSPMALTYAFAIGGAILLALTLTPVLSSVFMREDMEEKDSFDHAHASPRLHAALSGRLARTRVRRRSSSRCSRFLSSCARSASDSIGAEFMPKLEEGNLWIRATLPTSISLEQSASYVGRMRTILLAAAPTTRQTVLCDEKTAHAPRGGDGRLAARQAGRRNRCLGLLQHRALLPARAVRRVEGRAHQRENHGSPRARPQRRRSQA